MKKQKNVVHNFQPGTRILAKNIIVSEDTQQTSLNNNDVIVGPSGCGKTGGYVIPNIRRNKGSMVITDTKGTLAKLLTPKLIDSGYTVKTLDFVNMENSCRYNPLDYIRPGRTFGTYREQDVLTIANTLMPVLDRRDPFWENAAKSLIACCISFAVEALPKNECNLPSVLNLIKHVQDKTMPTILEEHAAEYPDSYAVRLYDGFKTTFNADRLWGSVISFALEALKMFDFKEAYKLCSSHNRFDIRDLGRKKMVLFVNVSDTDRTFDNLVNVFYSQLFHILCEEADSNPEHRLKIPVRIILDDFAANVRIPDFEKIISVIRSRDISVSLILQSISQLETMYTLPESTTILNNCDHLLYLGGQDVETARYISVKANRTPDTILNMGLQDAFLFTRGEKPKMVEKIKPYSDIEP